MVLSILMAAGEAHQKPGFIRQTSREQGYRKAAEFLLLIGQEEAVCVLRHLSDTEIEGIAREISAIGVVEGKAAKRVLQEFGYIAEQQGYASPGGLEKAREMLSAALADEKKVEAIVAKVARAPAPRPFSFLMDLEVDQVLQLLKHESAPVLSVILCFLRPEAASKVLSALPLARQKEIVLRVARLGRVDPEVLRRAEDTLRKQIREQGRIVTQEIDGENTLMQILRNLGSAEEQELLQGIEQTDAQLAERLKQRLFSIHVASDISDRDLQMVLAKSADNEIALLLRGLEQATAERVQKNLSSRRRATIEHENAALGPMPKSAVETAIQEFFDRLKEREPVGSE